MLLNDFGQSRLPEGKRSKETGAKSGNGQQPALK
jgi:hypothetical protein